MSGLKVRRQNRQLSMLMLMDLHGTLARRSTNHLAAWMRRKESAQMLLALKVLQQMKSCSHPRGKLLEPGSGSVLHISMFLQPAAVVSNLGTVARSHVSVRFASFLDSAVCCGALAKGRFASFAFQPNLKSACA